MTPDEFRTAREELGRARGRSKLTQTEMAAELKMGKHGWQTISDWETGKRKIPGPVQVAIGLMLEQAEFVKIERAE